MKFTDLPFNDHLLEGIAASNYEEMTPVQEKVIPLVLQGRDLIASAQTGTGKTAAFLLPLIHRILSDKSNDHHISAMIIVPTRELAVQIAEHLEGLSYFTSVSSIAVFGGGDGNTFIQEKQALSSGVDIVVCTPGKMISHIAMGYVKLKQLKYLVLDEADRMLDMGFYEDITRILQQLPPVKQTLLFSATMPPKIRSLANKILINPEHINIAVSRPPEKIIQKAYLVQEEQKIGLVQQILKSKQYKSIVIFCGSKQKVKNLTQSLKRAGLPAEEIHSDLLQQNREDILRGFTSKRIPILIATDILSRGIDVDHIDLVLNYDVPHDGEDYVHRIGRTARAESAGTAITLVTQREQRKLRNIETLLGRAITKEQLPRENISLQKKSR